MNKDNELSLIDLFAVIIKYKLLIIAVTLLPTALAMVVAIVQPRFMKGTNYRVRMELFPLMVPELLVEQLGVQPTLLAEFYLKNSDSKATAAKASGLPLKSISYTVTSSKETSGVMNYTGLSISLIGPNPDAGEAFLRSIVDQTDENMRRELSARAKAIIDSVNAVAIDTKSGKQVTSASAQLFAAGIDYVQGSNPVLRVASVSSRKLTISFGERQIVFIASAAFILAIALAFLLEYVEQIKADPEALAKITAALGKRRV